MVASPEVATSPLDNTRWISADEAANYVKVSRQTILGIIHRGELKAVRIGVLLRIDRADLDAWLTRRKKIIPPYRKGSRPWVAERHAKNRRKRR